MSAQKRTPKQLAEEVARAAEARLPDDTTKAMETIDDANTQIGVVVSRYIRSKAVSIFEALQDLQHCLVLASWPLMDQDAAVEDILQKMLVCMVVPTSISLVLTLK